MMGRRLSVLLSVIVLAGLVVGPAAVGSVAADSPDMTEPELTLLEDPTDDPDQIRNVIDLHTDGDATWTVEYRIDLDENNTDAFQELAAEINENPDPYVEDFRAIIEPNVEVASNETNREMTVENLTVQAQSDFQNDQGVVAYQFVWTQFAVVDGDTITAGDAIDGFLLGEDTSMTIGWASTYEATEILPEGDSVSDQSVTWQGQETDFGPGEPRVTIQPAETDSGFGTIGYAFGAFGLIAISIVLLIAYRYREGAEEIVLPDELPVPTDSSADSESTDESSSEEELLTNEEQVLKLLDQKGGRMKQQEVVTELDWTEAKTSQVITGMREEGDIEVYRIGRENVITDPDEELL